jgi:selenophosphate synthase
MNIQQQIRLSHLSHGGGCGCKLAPSVLQQLLSSQPTATPYKQLLVGLETGDDAAVWELDNGTCVIATTDFFMPMVDDPHDFGRIAATNAISDVYAMGGMPVMALAILGMPVDKIPPEMVRRILEGGAAVCATAGIPVAGGHSIDSPEPIYGLAVIGTAPKANIRRNRMPRRATSSSSPRRSASASIPPPSRKVRCPARPTMNSWRARRCSTGSAPALAKIPPCMRSRMSQASACSVTPSKWRAARAKP